MSLQARIERELGLRPKIKAGAPGSFSVWLDGARIYSKKAMGAPAKPQQVVQKPEDVVQMIRERLGRS